VDALLASIEQSGISTWIRKGVWPFALTNTAHVFGIALLFGSIAILDLRLLGLRRRGAAQTLGSLCVPVAAAGAVLAVGSGLAMFSANAREYLQNPYFIPKLTFIALAIVNIAALHLTTWRRRATWGRDVPGAARAAGGLSLLFWAGAIVCGRLVAYF